GDFATSVAGTYRWIAHYTGDANNNAVDTACNDANESSTVNPASPTISTQLSDAGPIREGGTVHDSSSLAGATPDAGGTVKHVYYSELSPRNHPRNPFPN